MARKHVVQVGESGPQVAARFGFEDWKTIYQHPDNAELRKKRTNESAIFPGDVVAIPEVEPKVFTLKTGQRHRIMIRRPLAKLNVVVKDGDGEPLTGKKFELRVAGRDKPLEGSTTGDGRVECNLPTSAKDAQLVVWVAGDKAGARYVWDLELGGLLPPETDDGVRQRLNNLGYHGGQVGGHRASSDDGDDSDDGVDPLSLAVAAFQEDMGLDVTGAIDDATRSKLIDVHGGT